ncbi:hypothetical protein TWF694_004650 [Orbilia ellipsospora]|uniref:LysM domain-containing protein n=1 Tax=Orbilia ellipsospora TaxID=2528407 RepID=A0AAV9X1X6_9PEZI
MHISLLYIGSLSLLTNAVTAEKAYGQSSSENEYVHSSSKLRYMYTIQNATTTAKSTLPIYSMKPSSTMPVGSSYSTVRYSSYGNESPSKIDTTTDIGAQSSMAYGPVSSVLTYPSASTYSQQSTETETSVAQSAYETGSAVTSPPAYPTAAPSRLPSGEYVVSKCGITNYPKDNQLKNLVTCVKNSNLSTDQLKAFCGYTCALPSPSYNDLSISSTNYGYYQNFLKACGSDPATLAKSLASECGCFDASLGDTCEIPHAPRDTSSPKPSTASSVPAVNYCPENYTGKSTWPKGNCLDSVFDTKEGMDAATVICNQQCGTSADKMWPAQYESLYYKVEKSCKSLKNVNMALAQGCGCLNNGWVGDCVPQCEEPVGLSKTMSTAVSTPIGDYRPSTGMSGVILTTYTKVSSKFCSPHTFTTVVPYLSTMVTSSAAASSSGSTTCTASASSSSYSSTTCTTSTSSSSSSSTTCTTSASSSSTISTTCTTSTSSSKSTTYKASSSSTITSMAPSTTSFAWTTQVYVTQSCSTCQPQTVTITVPCPQEIVTTVVTQTCANGSCSPTFVETTVTVTPAPSMATMAYATSNSAICTCGNQIPTCTVPPGPPQEGGYAPGCNQWYQVKPGDTWESIEMSLDHKVKKKEIMTWNDGCKVDCKVTPGRWFCVGKMMGHRVPYVVGTPDDSDNHGLNPDQYSNMPTPTPSNLPVHSNSETVSTTSPSPAGVYVSTQTPQTSY